MTYDLLRTIREVKKCFIYLYEQGLKPGDTVFEEHCPGCVCYCEAQASLQSPLDSQPRLPSWAVLGP